MKKPVSFLFAVLLLLCCAGAIDLYVDMEKIQTDTEPAISDGRTLVPLRAIFEALGAQVEWDEETKTATGVKDDLTVIIQIDNKTAYINGETCELDVPAKIINGRTMVPARFIAEALDCRVTWYGETQTVAVADETKGLTWYATPTGQKYHSSGTCNGGTYYETSQAEILGRGLTPCGKCIE